MKVKENVRNDEALQIIKNHIAGANICMMTNNILDWSLKEESLKNQWLDETGNIWFLYFNNNNAPYPLDLDSKMEVFYSNRVKSQFLSLIGQATWVSWSETENLKNFPFSKTGTSIETPFRLIRFSTQEAFYWDDIVKEMVPLISLDITSPKNGLSKQKVA
jgi:hypothetical protein